jgi:alginate O-acetyltransferase complex protein AlgJ
MKNKEFRSFDLLLILTFIAGIFLPLLSIQTKDVSDIEKRKLAVFPAVKWDLNFFSTFPSQFETFFNDRFGFRDRLVQLHSLSGMKLTNTPNPMVLVGLDNWLFYIKPTDGNSLEDYRKNDPLTAKELRDWKTALEARYIALQKKGIPYFFIVAPDKHSIYGEYIPTRIDRIGSKSRLDLLLEYMRDSEVPIIDLRAALLKSKRQGTLYYKTDTHWNEFGSAIAQNEMMQFISNYYPELKPINYPHTSFSQIEYTGDLANLLNLSSYIKEVSPKLRTNLPLCNRRILAELTVDPARPAIFTDCGTKAPQALIFRDSFFEGLQPYISQYFSKSLYIWEYLDLDRLDKYITYNQPKIVIEERVERSLKRIPLVTALDMQLVSAHWFETGIPVYQLAKFHQHELMSSSQLAITPTAGGYTLTSQDKDPHFILPKLNGNNANKYVIKIDLNTPQSTKFQILYDTLRPTRYNEKRSSSEQLKAGDNTVYIEIDRNDLQGQLRIDPGEVAGKYTLRSLEIRAIKNKRSEPN